MMRGNAAKLGLAGFYDRFQLGKATTGLGQLFPLRRLAHAVHHEGVDGRQAQAFQAAFGLRQHRLIEMVDFADDEDS
jgi:hypothetical protein